MNGVPRLRGMYAVLDAAVTPDLERLLGAVLTGGIRVVQYRAKSGIDFALAARLAAMTRAAGGAFVVNDDLHATLAIPGAGLHVGQEDLAAHAPETLRAALTGRVFGISCGTAKEAREAVRLGATYVGVGPFAATSTKRDAGTAIGAEGLRRVTAAVDVPVVAIGGIGERDLPAIVRSGAAMAAVVTAIALAADPCAATRRLVAVWDAADRADGGTPS